MNTTMFQVLFAAVALANPDVQVSAKIPLAQAVHETGNFTSGVYQRDNNMFGMTVPKVRVTKCTNKGSADKYAHFSNLLDCMRDYFDWLRAFDLKTDAQLDNFVRTRYAEDKAYYAKITKQIKALDAAKKYIDRSTMVAVGLVAVPAGGMVMVTAITHLLEALD